MYSKTGNNYKSAGRRVISLVLAIALICSFGLTSVFAQDGASFRNSGTVDSGKVETEKELFDAIADPTIETIKLDADINLTKTLAIDRDVTIDGNDKTINGVGNITGVTLQDGTTKKYHAVLIRGAYTVDISNLTIKDAKTNGYGLMASATNGAVNGPSPTVTLNNVNLNGNNGGGMLVRDSANVTVTGDMSLDKNLWGGIEVAANGKLDATNATLNFTAPNGATTGNYAVYYDGTKDQYNTAVTAGLEIKAPTDYVEKEDKTNGKEKVYFEEVADVAIGFTALAANGEANKTDTTELTITLDKVVAGLVASDITVTGATIGALTSTAAPVYTLAISNITLADGENVNVALAKTGFTFTPANKDVAVFKAAAPVEPTYTIKVDQPAVFEALTEGYAVPDAKTITVTNTGSAGVELILDTVNAPSFDFSALSKTTLGKDEKATLTIKPKAGLKAKYYDEYIYITPTGGNPNRVDVNVTVKAAPVVPSVTSVTVSPETASVEVEKTTELTATVVVVDGAAKTVTWTTSNKDIATVAADGTVTAVKAGTATITATSTVDDTKKDTATITVTAKPATKYAVTVTGGTTDKATAAKGETVTITANAPIAGKVFDKWTSTDSVTFASATTTPTTFAMLEKAVTVVATYKNAPSTGGGSSSGSSGGGTSTPSVDAPSSNVGGSGEVKSEDIKAETSKAVADAVKAAPGATANVTVKNADNITPAALKEMAAAATAAGGKAQLSADTVVNGVVETRLYINPALAATLTAPIQLGVSTNSLEIDATKAKFANFANNIAVASFAQQGSFGMKIQAAVKLDLTTLNTKTLVFYSYDKATNTYVPIVAPAYTIDKNGYLHFSTTVGGDIIITDKALVKK